MDEANSTPLDAERERLRKAGYTDADIPNGPASQSSLPTSSIKQKAGKS